MGSLGDRILQLQNLETSACPVDRTRSGVYIGRWENRIANPLPSQHLRIGTLPLGRARRVKDLQLRTLGENGKELHTQHSAGLHNMHLL